MKIALLLAAAFPDAAFEIIGIGENGAAGFAIGSLHDRHLRIELAQGLHESFTDKSMVFNDKQFQHGDSQ